ncbi:FtsX-like permease family protein [soil metagenome]
MTTAQLLQRNLTYFWRTNLAVTAGVAIAVAVLAGALLVGDSVRGSLRDLLLQRLGNTDGVVTSAGFFREQLAADIQNHEEFARGGFAATAPLIALEGSITHEASGRLGTGISVYGVDEKFWSFHGQQNRGPLNREILASVGLAMELGSRAGDALLLHVQRPSEIPVESLHSKKEDLGRTLRLTMRESLSSAALGDFSVQPRQSATRAVFVPLKLLQKELEQLNKANLILIAEASPKQANANMGALLEKILKDKTSLEDYGITLHLLDEQQSISLEHDSKLLNDSLAVTARQSADRLSMRVTPVLSYLAIRIFSGERSIAYSLVTALNEESLKELRQGDGETGGRGDEKGRADDAAAQPSDLPGSPSPRPPIILNEWAARALNVSEGDPVSLEYYLWHKDGRLETKTSVFQLAGIVAIAGAAADRNLVPEYPGITGSDDLSDWDPPFPVDLSRIRKQDEDYWDQHRTTPKAFIPLSTGQDLWASRFGNLTSLRLNTSGMTLPQALDSYQQQLRSTIEPARMGFNVIPVRLQGLAASRGATNFGEYFLYFSFFLVISALLLTALFFKLGIEQRLREIGLLQAIGYPASRVRRLFLLEGMVISMVGSVIGLAGALAYGQLMMTGLSTWWVAAVGTTMLKLHVAPLSLLLGAVGGVVAALICIVWTLRRLGKVSSRSLLMGTLDGVVPESAGEATLPAWALPLSISPRLLIALILTLVGLVLLLLASFQVVGQTAGFFGGGLLFLAATLCYQSAWLRRTRGKSIHGTGWWPVSRLGFRNATYHPGRSVLCISLIASAAFIIVSVDAFRRRESTSTLDRKSGNGGFPLLAESLLPLVHDPNTREGREALNLVTGDSESSLSSTTFTRFRVRPGDDASCLNLYQPRNPRIIAPADDFIQSGRFVFQNSLAESNEEKNNPWLLLNRESPDGAIPVIADANSLTYVLHLKLGDEFILQRQGGQVRLRVVASLADSILQSELVMAEKNFLHLFPEQEGYRFFLIDTPDPNHSSAQSSAIATTLEDRLSDFGFYVVPTSERLASFHRVENTYLSTFQMLGGLGLLLGTFGMAAVLLRNVLERRRELALLRAVGYNSSHFALMVIAENALLLFCGLITGTVCALLAIAPVFFERGGRLPNISLGLLLVGVLVSGLTASLVATWAALRSPLLPALRAE